ncbi:ComEC/Rec2 family competence protein [Stratiformator vulcanicus]|uniref:ComEC/Rec2 family competence protein n=1 Tax=Stratiformator vulcanicus TaxID=2527980 RepID=UPI002877F5EB|nr:ComEC/Rec2 family competence protein [Stratiformator vulcanicus]
MSSTSEQSIENVAISPIRRPAVAICIACATGIAFDRFVSPELRVWLVAGFVFVVMASILRLNSFRRAATLGVLLLMVTVGGALSHWHGSIRGPGAIAAALGDEPRLMKFEGVVVSRPIVDRRRARGIRAAWPLVDRTLFEVRIESLSDQQRRRPTSGVVRLYVSGHCTDIEVGRRVTCSGWLAKPPEWSNPGDRDLARDLRFEGIDGFCFVDHPDLVKPSGRFSSANHISLMVRSLFGEISQRISTAFRSDLSPRNAMVADALFLGRRENMDEGLRDQFIEAGVLHLLAISGLHVGIFWGGVALICRLLRLSSPLKIIVPVVAVFGYAAITEFPPSLARAALFVGLLSATRLCGRGPDTLNLLFTTAGALMVWRPSILFDVGAQLSFLSVIGIRCAVSTIEPLRRIAGGKFSYAPLQAMSATVGAMLFSGPLVVYRFGMFAPAALLLNLIVVPLVVVPLWLGYCLMVSVIALPGMSGPIAFLLDQSLTLFLMLIDGFSATGVRALRLPAPPTPVLVLLYASLLSGALLWERVAIRRRIVFGCVTAATLLSIGTLFAPVDQRLRVTFLDVGHGTSILIESPGGTTALYDCGCLSSDRRAAEVAGRAVRQSSASLLDLLMVSHADVDHFNGVPRLLRRYGAATIATTPHMLRSEQPAATQLISRIIEDRIPLNAVSAGDGIDLGDGCRLQILAPFGEEQFQTDNEASLVVRIDYADRRILLTGDIEGDGLRRLIEQLSDDKTLTSRCDVLMAPHHGGRDSNVPDLATAVRPSVVVMSSASDDPLVRIQQNYPDARCIGTSQGAVRIAIDRSGKMTVEQKGRELLSVESDES